MPTQEAASVQESSASDSDIREEHVTKAEAFHRSILEHTGRHDTAHSSSTMMRSLLPIPILLILMVVLHIAAAIILSKTGSTFSFNNPMSYGMFGLLLVLVLIKIKRLLSFMHSKAKQSTPETTYDNNSPDGAQQERNDVAEIVGCIPNQRQRMR